MPRRQPVSENSRTESAKRRCPGSVLGTIVLQNNKAAAVLGLMDQAIAVHPDPALFCNRAVALHALQRFDEAIASHDKPDYASRIQQSRHCSAWARRIARANWRSISRSTSMDLPSTNIFAVGARPIQVNYLGRSGTMSASPIDDLIANPTLIPKSLQQHYLEKIACLPHGQRFKTRDRG